MNIELSRQELTRVIYCVDKWLKHLDNTAMDRSRYDDLPPLLEKLEMFLKGHESYWSKQKEYLSYPSGIGTDVEEKMRLLHDPDAPWNEGKGKNKK